MIQLVASGDTRNCVTNADTRNLLYCTRIQQKTSCPCYLWLPVANCLESQASRDLESSGQKILCCPSLSTIMLSLSPFPACQWAATFFINKIPKDLHQDDLHTRPVPIMVNCKKTATFVQYLLPISYKLKNANELTKFCFIKTLAN